MKREVLKRWKLGEDLAPMPALGEISIMTLVVTHFVEILYSRACRKIHDKARGTFTRGFKIENAQKLQHFFRSQAFDERKFKAIRSAEVR